MVIKHGVSEQLDQFRELYDRLDDILSQSAVLCAQKLANTNIIFLAPNAKMEVIYYPQLGYHIILRLSGKTVFGEDDLQVDGLQYQVLPSIATS